MFDHAGVEREIARVCGHLNAMHGQLLDQIIDVVDNNGWVGVGFRSPEHWVSLQTGMSPSRSRSLVLLARRAHELPVTVQALREGRLSIDQAVVVAQTIPAHNDREACDLAIEMSVWQLRHSLGKYAFDPAYPPAADPPEPEPEPRAEPEPADGTEPDEADTGGPPPPPIDPRLAAGELSYFFDEHGRFRLRLDAPLEDGLLIEAALKEARDALFRAGHLKVSWMDAFNEICRRSMASNNVTGIGVSRSDRFRVYVHLDTEGAWVNGNIRVPQALLDQILSDGVVRPVWTTGGKPVNVGRTTKVISPELRRLVLHRDGHRCRTPGCTNTLDLHVHHIKWFGRDLGLTETKNTVTECGICHRQIHRGEINIAGNADQPDGLTYTDQRGHSLIRHPVPIPPQEPPPEPDAPFVHPGGARMDTRWLWFRPPPPQPPPAHAA